MELLQEKKVYCCTFAGCLSYFERPYRLAQHILAHNNIRPYACTQANCSKAYTSKSHLDRHINSVHMPHENDVVYSCPQCFKAFANRQNLKRHLNTVHFKAFNCEVCHMSFKKKNQLSAHMYHHTGIKAFNCEFCAESFISLYLKKRHMRYHKTYTCEECSMQFNHWSKYQEHKKNSHERSEYICDKCGRTFKLRGHIVRHLKIHTEEHMSRTFTCPYENCERYYSRNSNLKQHILVKHMRMFHECTLCNAQLSTKAKLNYHIQLHYTTGVITPKQNTTIRKERKDEGSFKSSIALKLAGLSEIPDELNSTTTTTPLNLSVKPEIIEVEVDFPV